jgi:hypothetical protein
MRTIEEINKELEAVREEENKLFRKTMDLIHERTEAERAELKQFDGKYIRLNKEDLMWVDKQTVLDDFVVLSGLIICVDDNRKYDWGQVYGEFKATGSVNFNVRMGELKLTLDSFKDRTLSGTGDIKELDINEFMDEAKRLVDKFSDATCIWGWRSMTNTIVE